MTLRIVFTILQHPEILLIFLILCLAGLSYCVYSLIKIYNDEREFRRKKYLNKRNWGD